MFERVAGWLDEHLETTVRRKVWGERIVWLPERIDAAGVGLVFDAITGLSGQGRQPILLVCDSSGGEIEPAMRLARFIRASKVDIHTCALERAASAAVLVLAAGRRRLIAKGAVAGVHGTRYLGDNGKTYPVAEVLNIVNTKVFGGSKFRTVDIVGAEFLRLMDEYAGRRLPESIFSAEMTWLTPLLTVQLGLADDVGRPFSVREWWTLRKSV